MVLLRIGRQRKMRRNATGRSPRATLRLVGAGVGESGSAYSPFGPVRAGLITTQRTNEDQVLTELLNSLERKIADLNIRSYEVLNTYLSDTIPLVKPTTFFLNTTTTNMIE